MHSCMHGVSVFVVVVVVACIHVITTAGFLSYSLSLCLLLSLSQLLSQSSRLRTYNNIV